MKLAQRQKLFQKPSREFRGKPFWSWNGKLEEKELKRQIDIMKEMGFGGFFMHSRTGLETEYLGEDWFHLINSCAEYGSKKRDGNLALRRRPLALWKRRRYGD